MNLDQPRTVGRHFCEILAVAGYVSPEPVSKVGVDALVLFFQRNPQGQDLALSYFVEVPGHERSFHPRPAISAYPLQSKLIVSRMQGPADHRTKPIRRYTPLRR
jgi:hypothetical protein